MSEMSYQLKYMHEDAEKIESLFAVTITNQDGKKVPTVIMVTDTLSEEQKEEMRKRLWEIAGILREARAQPVSVPDEVSVALGVVNDAANDSRHRGDYDRANALVQARIALWRAAQPASVAERPLFGKYGDVLTPFVAMMEHELHANAGKGDRPGWLSMDRKTALLELYYHLSKLQKAMKHNDAAGIMEYAADVANMSMMAVDVCGLLAAAPQPPAKESE